MNYNKVIIAGRLTRDVELKYTPKGTAIGQFSIAANRNWKTESGEKKEEVSFVDCTTFGKQAETISQYFRKGGEIFIEGRLKQETWDDKQTGSKRSKLGVVVEGFSFVGSNKKDDSESSTKTSDSAGHTTASGPAAKSPVQDDDIPF